MFDGPGLLAHAGSPGTDPSCGALSADLGVIIVAWPWCLIYLRSREVETATVELPADPSDLFGAGNGIFVNARPDMLTC